jgi:hypothetical protein
VAQDHVQPRDFAIGSSKQCGSVTRELIVYLKIEKEDPLFTPFLEGWGEVHHCLCNRLVVTFILV